MKHHIVAYLLLLCIEPVYLESWTHPPMQYLERSQHSCHQQCKVLLLQIKTFFRARLYTAYNSSKKSIQKCYNPLKNAMRPAPYAHATLNKRVTIKFTTRQKKIALRSLLSCLAPSEITTQCLSTQMIHQRSSSFSSQWHFPSPS